MQGRSETVVSRPQSWPRFVAFGAATGNVGSGREILALAPRDREKTTGKKAIPALETSVYSCYIGAMKVQENETSVEVIERPIRVLGWSQTSRLVLIAICLLGSLAFGRFPRTAEPRDSSDLRIVVDPNTAPSAVLLALPRLGPALVGRIVAQRETEPFRSLDDLDRRVKGIGPATIKSLRPYLNIERPDSANARAAGPR